MRFASFVITFNRPDQLREVLARTLSQTRRPEAILVVDNGRPEAAMPVVESFAAERIRYVSLGENLGPAGAAAFALRQLAGEGWDWIGWGDDDTPPQTPDTLERLIALAQGAGAENVGGVGAVGARFDWTQGELRRLPDDALHGPVEVDSIGSGHQLITRREVVDRVGLPNADLFFGFYDPEYCLRIRRAGYALLVDGDLMRTYREKAGRLELELKHSPVPRGTPTSMWRRYYVTRNYIFMMRNTFERPDLARREALKALVRSLTAWSRGPAYGGRFARLQLRGVLDGYRGRLGRSVLPVPKSYE